MIKLLINSVTWSIFLLSTSLVYAQTPSSFDEAFNQGPALTQHEHDIDTSAKKNKNTRILGPWTIHCEKKTYPNKGQAKRYTNGKRISLTICSAKQTISQYVNHKLITATYEITPFSVFIATKNFQADQTNAQIITGKKRTFGLYADCHNIDGDTCVFMLRRTKYHQLLKEAMKNSFHLILKLKESHTNQPVNLVFSLEYIDAILQEIQNEERVINRRFKQVFKKPSYWQHYAMIEAENHHMDCSKTNSCFIDNDVRQP